MGENGKSIRGLDIPIVKLVPRNERKASTKQQKRIEASLRAVGLLEPLLVYPKDDNYEILDGCLRYRILLDMGVESVPCLIGHDREAFTGNRMVNQLSAFQEMRMLRKSLEELDEKTIANTFGIASIGHRLNVGLMKRLEPTVAKAFEDGKITLQCAKEFAYVKPERQAEIIGLMESCNDYSITFVRGLILKTPIAKRAKLNGNPSPWSRADQNKNDLLKKLKEAEQQQDFYSNLYRQYTTNLLKLVIFARSLVTNERVKSYLAKRHPQHLLNFEQIIDSTER